MQQASAVMGALAKHVGANEEAWRLIGLLHNLDFDRVKEADKHCLETAKVLKACSISRRSIEMALQTTVRQIKKGCAHTITQFRSSAIMMHQFTQFCQL